MANIKILLQTAHVSLAQRRISPRAAPAMASQVWRRRNRRRRSEGKQEQEGTCSQALSLSSPTPIPLFLSLPIPRALSRARSLSLARARALSNTHKTHVSTLAYPAHFSSQPLLFVSQRQVDPHTMWITGDGSLSPYAESYHAPSATKAAKQYLESSERRRVVFQKQAVPDGALES